jgi:hypothetical protein
MDSMTVVSQLAKYGCRVAWAVAFIAATAISGHAQTGVSFLPPVDVRLSTTGAGYGSNAVTFSSASQSLSCPASGIVATVSSTADGTGNVLADNFINLTLTQGGTTKGPTNICSGGVVENGNQQQDCFTTGYQGPAGSGELTGQDPDGTIAAEGGIAPIDISKQLVSGANTIQFDLVDTGGYLASTSIYLYTNCTANGTSGGQVSGNPIPSTNPPASALTQTFPFSSTTGKVVSLVFDLSRGAQDQTLNIINGATPTGFDAALDPSIWPAYVKGTSFATSQCLIHSGELFNDLPACKLYTLTCQIGQGSEASGVQCPSSTARNIVLQDVFDFPPLSLPDIDVTLNGRHEVFHQGFGFLEASEGWTGGPCTFDPGADQIFSCPENLLTLFEGPGLGRGTATPSPSVNSTFITVGPVPEIKTNVSFQYFGNPTWVNSRDVQVLFSANPPRVPQPNNGFVASPVYSVTYGVSPADALPSTEFPVKGDTTLLNPAGCPGSLPAKTFVPAPAQISVAEDGTYLLHYFATDCAGTEELHFYQGESGSWHTKFYTADLNVDTVAPTVPYGPVLSPAPSMIGGTLGYCRKQAVTASFQCADDRSGVLFCGGHHYADPITEPPALTSPVNTSTLGAQVFSVRVRDAAQNEGIPASVPYTVLNCTAP